MSANPSALPSHSVPHPGLSYWLHATVVPTTLVPIPVIHRSPAWSHRFQLAPGFLTGCLWASHPANSHPAYPLRPHWTAYQASGPFHTLAPLAGRLPFLSLLFCMARSVTSSESDLTTLWRSPPFHPSLTSALPTAPTAT